MKLAPVILIGSLAANALCLGIVVYRPTLAPAALRGLFKTQPTAAKPAVVEKDPSLEAARLLETQAKLWATLQTDDLPALVARLRAAGFPPAVVLAVVNAELDARFAPRFKALRAENDNRPYWKPTSGGYSNFGSEYYTKMRQLNRERSKLMKEVLGNDYLALVANDLSDDQQRRFGSLPKAKTDLLQRVEDDYSELRDQVREGNKNVMLPEDRAKMEMIEQERKSELQSMLTPEEYQDYEMRTSPLTSNLRRTMTEMDASEAEFRAIFAIQNQFEQQLNPLRGMSGSYSSEMSEKRQEAEAQVLAQIKATLGDARAADYARAKDYEYQNIARLAAQENLPKTAAVQAYDLRKSTMDESNRIYNDKTLTSEQKIAAMQTLAQTTTAKLTETLGAKAGASYTASASWLKAISKGTSVRVEGTTTYYETVRTSKTNP